MVHCTEAEAQYLSKLRKHTMKAESASRVMEIPRANSLSRAKAVSAQSDHRRGRIETKVETTAARIVSDFLAARVYPRAHDV